jgi:elongation factor G
MSLEVICEPADIGGVVGDLGRRRAQVLGMEPRGDAQAIRAEVPLAEAFGYASALAGLTHGRGRFTLEPCRYAEVA